MTKQQTGKGKYGDRQYVEAYALSGEKLTEVYRANVAAIYGEDMSTEGRDVRDGEYVAVRVKDDGSLPGRDWRRPEDNATTWAVICSEGVGWVADDYNAIEVTVLGHFGQNSRLFIYVERIPDMFTGETVDLADHIRTFGDRLEGNFHLWAGRAVSSEPVPA